ncbi:MAG: SH3 domain-containing protein [Anaerolineales bacterium]|nr:SH3 domain-containing protein [Anaerolineales bacterium]
MNTVRVKRGPSVMRWAQGSVPGRNFNWVKTAVVFGVCLLLACLPGIPAHAATVSPAVARNHLVPMVQQAPPSPDAPLTVTATTNANLRGGPGTNFPVVGGVKAGQTLEVVAENAAGDWYQLASGNWIFAALVEDAEGATSAAPPAQGGAPQTAAAAQPASGNWVLFADSAADFPGGRDRNYWAYLWTEGRQLCVAGYAPDRWQGLLSRHRK